MTDEKEIKFGQDVDNTDDKKYSDFIGAVEEKLNESNIDIVANVKVVDCIPEPFDPLDEMSKFPIALRICLHAVYDQDSFSEKYVNGFNTESLCVCRAMGYEACGAMHRILHAVCEYGETAPNWAVSAALDLNSCSKEELADFNYYLDAYYHQAKQYR